MTTLMLMSITWGFHSSIAQNELRGWRRREGETERINTHQEDAW